MTRTTPAAHVVTGYACPACKSGLVSDHLREELVCPRCGIVASERHGSREDERRGLGPGPEKGRGTRASGKTTLLRHDMGISTDIDPAGRDYRGNRIPQEAASHVRSMRKWQKRMRTSTPEDRRLAEVLRIIETICEAASVADTVRETAAMTYRLVAKKVDVKGRSTVGMAAASIHVACKRHGIVKSLDDLCAAACASADEAARKAKIATRCYRDIVIETSGMQGAEVPAVPITRYISRTANVARVGARIERLALRLAEVAPGGAALGGKTPQGVAAAYLYIASALLGQAMVQRDISAAAGIGDVTVRNRCRDILAQHRIRIVTKAARRRGASDSAAPKTRGLGASEEGEEEAAAAAAAAEEEEAERGTGAAWEAADGGRRQATRQSRLFGF